MFQFDSDEYFSDGLVQPPTRSVTVDGRNCLHQLIGIFSHDLRGFDTSRVVMAGFLNHQQNDPSNIPIEVRDQIKHGLYGAKLGLWTSWVTFTSNQEVPIRIRLGGGLLVDVDGHRFCHLCPKGEKQRRQKVKKHPKATKIERRSLFWKVQYMTNPYSIYLAIVCDLFRDG